MTISTRMLFDGALPDVFITYQRKANSAGYFSPIASPAASAQSGKHELALNPDGFIGQSDEQIMQTLVHEMAHVWQHTHGKPAARGYHNKEWAAKMKAIGLQPISTGMVGGKETGQRMRDYPIPGGPFAKAFAELAATGWKLNLQSAHRGGEARRRRHSKTKFTCPLAVRMLGASPTSPSPARRAGLTCRRSSQVRTRARCLLHRTMKSCRAARWRRARDRDLIAAKREDTMTADLLGGAEGGRTRVHGFSHAHSEGRGSAPLIEPCRPDAGNVYEDRTRRPPMTRPKHGW